MSVGINCDRCNAAMSFSPIGEDDAIVINANRHNFTSDPSSTKRIRTTVVAKITDPGDDVADWLPVMLCSYCAVALEKTMATFWKEV